MALAQSASVEPVVGQFSSSVVDAASHGAEAVRECTSGPRRTKTVVALLPLLLLLSAGSSGVDVSEEEKSPLTPTLTAALSGTVLATRQVSMESECQPKAPASLVLQATPPTVTVKTPGRAPLMPVAAAAGS